MGVPIFLSSVREVSYLFFATQCLIRGKLSEKTCCVVHGYFTNSSDSHQFLLFASLTCQSSTSPQALLGLPLPLHQQEPDPLSTDMFPSSDNWPSLPACPPAPSSDFGFPFMEEQKTAAWGHMEPLHLPTAHWQTPASKAPLLFLCQKRGASKPLAYVQLNTQHSTVCSAVLYHHLHLMG